MQQLPAPARHRDVSSIEADDVPTGDELTAFVAGHGQALTRFAYLLTGGDGPAAEDLVQTVLLRLVDRGLTGLNDPLAYARRSLVNENRDQVRRQHTRRLAQPLLQPIPPTAPAAAADDRLAVLTALSTLTVRERSAVVLRYYEDLADDDIAHVLGCSRNTVRSLIHRATPKLQQALAGTFGSPHRPVPRSTTRRDRR